LSFATVHHVRKSVKILQFFKFKILVSQNNQTMAILLQKGNSQQVLKAKKRRGFLYNENLNTK
jgi:hypothetical protein